jgi:phosphate transport system substrate-binding protein
MISRRQFVIGLMTAPLFWWIALLDTAPSRKGRTRRRLSVMGATSLMGYVKAALPGWEQQHAGVRVAVSPGGSYAGLKGLSTGQVDLALSDIDPPPGFVVVPVHRFPLGRIAILIIVNCEAGVKSLSWHQVRALFEGTITNWRDVGGKELPVVVVSRSLSSGARQVIQDGLLKRAELSSHAIIQLSNGAVAKTVRETPGAVGYVEAVMPLSGVLVVDLGAHHYHPANPVSWPLYAEPSIYVRRDAEPLAPNLAEYLARGSERFRFGIYSVAREGEGGRRG